MVYDSKYGNTKAVAEQIAQVLRGTEGLEAEVNHVKNVDNNKLLKCDALVVGAPNHMGKPSRTIVKFVDSSAKLELGVKYVAAFDTYFQRQRYFMKATRKLEKQISGKLPSAKLMPGFSAKVNGVNGPIADGELEKAKEYGKATGKLLINET